jgi:hypothetical protein
VNLEDKISTHIDPFLQKANGTKLSDHFGPDIDKVQIHHLLHMTSGIHDYDRGNYSQDQFASPTRDFDPIEIIGTYVPPGFDFQPGSKQSYCSTNYILLGMVLANHLGDTKGEWKSYDQRSVFPASIRADLNKSMFIDKGTCSKYTPVHGIMAPSFYDRNATSDTDVWNVSCVGGWTGGNYVGAVGDVAQYTYALYKPESTIVSKARLANMLNFSAPRSHGKFYGMATFSLDWSVTDVTSDPPVTTEGYGHVGDTYGYQVELILILWHCEAQTVHIYWCLLSKSVQLFTISHLSASSVSPQLSCIQPSLFLCFSYTHSLHTFSPGSIYFLYATYTQSQTTYFPELDFALTVATNVESANQAQPAETTCKLYHAIAAAVQGKPDPACTFVVPRRFIGKCSCGTSGSS